MKEQDFVYWLQGFFEISNSNKLSEKQVKIIKDHLALVFKKKTPNRHGAKLPASPLDQKFCSHDSNKTYC